VNIVGLTGLEFNAFVGLRILLIILLIPTDFVLTSKGHTHKAASQY